MRRAGFGSPSLFVLIWRAGCGSCRREILLYHTVPPFVNRQFAQRSCQADPETCVKLFEVFVDLFQTMCYYNNVRRKTTDYSTQVNRAKRRGICRNLREAPKNFKKVLTTNTEYDIIITEMRGGNRRRAEVTSRPSKTKPTKTSLTRGRSVARIINVNQMDSLVSPTRRSEQAKVLIKHKRREVIKMTVIMDEKNTIVQRTCPICGETFEISIPTDDYINWQNGELIQNAMPYLSPSSREFLISGMCGECQDKVFGGDEE